MFVSRSAVGEHFRSILQIFHRRIPNLSTKYYSLVGRRGKKRALIAVGHKILIMVYYILKTGMPCKELGKDYLSRRREDKIVKGHIKRLKYLGYDGAIKKAA